MYKKDRSAQCRHSGVPDELWNRKRTLGKTRAIQKKGWSLVKPGVAALVTEETAFAARTRNNWAGSVRFLPE